MQKNFGLTNDLVKATLEVLKSSKTDLPLQEKIIRDNLEGKRETDTFTSAYASVISEERKKAIEQEAKFAADALKSHLRMGKSIVEQTTPKTPREKELAAKKHPKDKITHADVLKVRGVIESLEEVVENELVPIAIRAGITKRMGTPVEEQKEIVNNITREFLLSLKEALNNVGIEQATINAIVEEFTTMLFNSPNVGIAVDKINEAEKVMGVIKRHVKEPQAEKPAAKEGLNKMTKMEEVSVDEATLSAKAARAGKDIGKPGKMFSKIAAKAAKRYGSKEAGERVAGAILKKMRAEDLDISDKDIDALIEAEQRDTPGQHQCALHVKHAKMGEGRTLFSQHAEPAEDGSIEWYDVMFEHGIEKKVATASLEILVSESHMNHKKKK